MPKIAWDSVLEREIWGQDYLDRLGYIPCCTEVNLKYVLNYYLSHYAKEELLILVLDVLEKGCNIRWEEWKNSGNTYPHIYSGIRRDAIVSVFSADKWDDDNNAGVDAQ